MLARDLVYNDAPWMENHTLAGKRFAHPSISIDLANRLGVQSLRCLSLVDEEMTKDLPCMDYSRINELLVLYGNNDFLLFDLLELADCCKAKKLHLIFDKREHPCQSLLQHNLGNNTKSEVIAFFEEPEVFYCLKCANDIGIVPQGLWTYLLLLLFIYLKFVKYTRSYGF